MRRSLLALGIVSLFLAVSSSAFATALPPGSTVVPNLLAAAPGTLLASTSQPINTGSFTGTLVAAVFAPTGDALGGLDFYYQVTNNAGSTSSIGRETNFNFQGWNTDVFVRTDNAAGLGGFIVGTEGPDTADREASGHTVGFEFKELEAGGKLNPGETSFILVIRTNATNFEPGVSSVINGHTMTVPTFQPIRPPGAVPEPATLLLLGAGLAGLARSRVLRKG